MLAQNQDSSFNGLTQATENILAHALWLAKQKAQMSKTEYKKLLKQHGWKGEDKRYLKVAAVFEHFKSQDLSQIEPATIFRLANNSKKYHSLIDQLQNLPEINQAVVRELIAKERQPKEPKQELPSIWRRTKDGGRYCQIPPIHETDERTGTTLQKMMDEEGLSAQSIIAEAVALLKAYKEGRLVLVESIQSSVEEEISKDWDDLNTEAETEVFKEDIEGIWTEEPEQEKDDSSVDDGEYAAVIEPKPECCAQSPVEELIEIFQVATTWGEIREALLVHKDYKQQAWEALTPLEKKRVRSLIPLEVKKLSEAKKAGLIVDFQELREGIFQVQRMGNLLGEIVSSSRLDAFLAQLRCDGQSFA